MQLQWAQKDRNSANCKFSVFTHITKRNELNVIMLLLLRQFTKTVKCRQIMSGNTAVQFIREIRTVFDAITDIQNVNATVVSTLELGRQTFFRIV